ncbi:MAG: segregation/condensation protein A [Myxococcota bacterium]
MRIEPAIPGGAGEPAAPFTVHTDVFEGPLDLLLYLVKRDGIDLRDLSVAHIADAYLEYLGRMQALDLSLAADWLVMAATLIHLKSLELFPRASAEILDDEEALDPKEQLRRQLEDYERVKAAAEALESRPWAGRDFYARAPLERRRGPRPVRTDLSPFGLLDLYHAMLVRKDKVDAVVQMHNSGPDVGECCARVLNRLGKVNATIDLVPLLRSLPTGAERVVTFVGTLEMCRLHWLEVEQEVHLGPVTVRQVRPTDKMDLALILGDEHAGDVGARLVG